MAFTKIRALMTKLSDNFPFLGTVTGTTVADNSITNAKFASTIAASNFSGALPAIDGSALTGLSATTTSASDPLITTNGTLGDVFINTTSGETYICTDATTDENVWTNVGSGDGDIQPPAYPGESYGYVAGGTYPTSGPINSDRIHQFNFATEADATHIGNILVAGGERTGCSMPYHGYWANGYPPAVGSSNVIERMAFAIPGDGTSDVGDLSTSRRNASSSSSQTHCYWHGGDAGITLIERSADASQADAGEPGTLETGYNNGTGSSDQGAGYGYVAGGYQTTRKIINRFQFAANADGTNIGDLAQGAGHAGGGASLTHSYTMGGAYQQNWIQKYAFGSSTSGSDIGNLSNAVWGSCGISSLTNSYNCGGDIGLGGGNSTDVINKVSHSSDGNGSGIATLATSANYLGQTGAHY
jgi:hypothetical protein